MRVISTQKVVIKVGTSSLTYANGKLHYQAIEKLVQDIVDLMNAGVQVLLVSSGAVGAGLGRLGWLERPKTIPEKQAVAAIGQGLLMQVYERLFSQYGQIVAQVLLTREDIADRQRYLNARNALNTLLTLKVVPIINENDTVAVEELKFGDNDTLSALVASVIDADLLIILSDIDGVYTKDPKSYDDAILLSEISYSDLVEQVNPGGAGSSRGTGGMQTKLQAAKIATAAGTGVVVANATEPHVLLEICQGKPVGTYIKPASEGLRNRERWIAFNLPCAGKVEVDEGAYQAIKFRGKSLLPSGIRQVHGSFSLGDAIEIVSESGTSFARGLVNYSSEEVARIKGRKSLEIEKVLGYRHYDEVVHRDNLVLLS